MKTTPQAALTSSETLLDIHAQLQQALMALRQGDPQKALTGFERILRHQPDHVDALHFSGVIAYQLKQYPLAIERIERSLLLLPQQPAALNNLGITRMALSDHAGAVAHFEQALALKPDFAEAWVNLGNSSCATGQFQQALAQFDQALKYQPGQASTHYNRGIAHLSLNRLAEALEDFDHAIRLHPAYWEAHYNRGVVLKQMGRFRESQASHEQAIALNPRHAPAHLNLGNALLESKQWGLALASYNQALSLNPNEPFLLGQKLHTQMMLCDWTGLDRYLHSLKDALQAGQKVCLPFPLLALIDDPALQSKSARTLCEYRYPDHASAPAPRTPDGRIRVGYFSADFHHHATAYLMAELFEAHDKKRFEFVGFSYGPDLQDSMRARIEQGLGHVIDIRHHSDSEVAALSRQMGIDIAVDLKGYTQQGRPGIMAARCAPIQVSYLGYPGTLGAHYIDYLMADRMLVPVEHLAHYIEHIVTLPHSYQVNDSKRRISERVFTRQEVGLPPSGFVFCCFNNVYKILPDTFFTWMRILRAVPDSVLWLLDDNPDAVHHLRSHAQAQGIALERLVFAPRMPLDEHLARHRLADLFLDTLPYNAHTTASDALWAGLPLLTQMGQSFAARVAASLLQTLGLPELITHSSAEYEARAIALAQTPQALQALRERLMQARHCSPLFDGRRFARHLEAAYSVMHQRLLAGLPAQDLSVQE